MGFLIETPPPIKEVKQLEALIAPFRISNNSGYTAYADWEGVLGVASADDIVETTLNYVNQNETVEVNPDVFLNLGFMILDISGIKKLIFANNAKIHGLRFQTGTISVGSALTWYKGVIGDTIELLNGELICEYCDCSEMSVIGNGVIRLRAGTLCNTNSIAASGIQIIDER